MKAGLMCQPSSLKTSPGLVSLPGFVQLLHKIMNAAAVERVGIKISKILVIGNIDMFYHPKYYKELRKRNKLDQAISLRESETSAGERSPGPGLKQQGASSKPQADKAQATETQASSSKR